MTSSAKLCITHGEETVELPAPIFPGGIHRQCRSCLATWLGLTIDQADELNADLTSDTDTVRLGALAQARGLVLLRVHNLAVTREPTSDESSAEANSRMTALAPCRAQGQASLPIGADPRPSDTRAGSKTGCHLSRTCVATRWAEGMACSSSSRPPRRRVPHRRVLPPPGRRPDPPQSRLRP